MKKRLVFLIICLFILSGCKTKEPVTVEEYIKDEIDTDISFCTIEEEKDTHGGFHGDGEYVVKANCSSEQQKILDQLDDWNKLPLPENLQLIMYGGERYGVTYSYNLAKKANIPEIINGYYYFLNRHSDAINEHSDDIFGKSSRNFTIAFYDIDTSMFYYYEEDT